MLLTKDNLPEWKAELRRLMKEQHGVEDFDESNRDETWLEDYIDCIPQDAIDDEVDCWEPVDDEN